MFAGAATLYGESPVPLERSTYPNVGAGLHFVIKPAQRMLVNFEYAQGIGDSRGAVRPSGMTSLGFHEHLFDERIHRLPADVARRGPQRPAVRRPATRARTSSRALTLATCLSAARSVGSVRFREI